MASRMQILKEAILDEMDSIMHNNTWKLADLPPGCKPLGSKWIFKRKMKVDGSIDKYKARLASVLNTSVDASGKEHLERCDSWVKIIRENKYLKGTMDYGLTYTGFPSVLEGYSDASWITNREDHSSTSGWVFLLGGGAICWASKKQTCITDSTMESEFVALAAAGKEAEWLRNLIYEIPFAKGFQYSCYDPDTPWNECKPVLGMKFESPSQLKQCLANYGVTHGYQLWYMQNDTYKLLVKCGRDVSAAGWQEVEGKLFQVNEASGSKSNLTPEEHAEIMDKEAFADMVRKDAENKAKDEEMWRQAYKEEKHWEDYASEFKDWEFREEEENRIGIMLSVDDEHIIGNTEPVNPAEQTHVIASASSAPVDEQPETSQDPSTEKAGSSAPVDQFPEPQDLKKKANKRKKKADSEQPLPFRIYHKNRGRSERIAKLQAKKFKFDANGTGSTPEKAFDVSD
ncbi:hypothetical protein Tco_0838727 [Tanacetum coccineum]|uniref:Zinc finger, CCHC-type n=1 Tax=Tanacetum coccineum TaxID=301880 RepID=A0ABQ5ANN5_9ASTR